VTPKAIPISGRQIALKTFRGMRWPIPGMKTGSMDEHRAGQQGQRSYADVFVSTLYPEQKSIGKTGARCQHRAAPQAE
jgi:hypothetical protein